MPVQRGKAIRTKTLLPSLPSLFFSFPPTLLSASLTLKKRVTPIKKETDDTLSHPKTNTQNRTYTEGPSHFTPSPRQSTFRSPKETPQVPSHPSTHAPLLCMCLRKNVKQECVRTSPESFSANKQDFMAEVERLVSENPISFQPVKLAAAPLHRPPPFFPLHFFLTPPKS